MFGQTTQPSTNLFGNTAPSAFGQTNTTSSFGMSMFVLSFVFCRSYIGVL